MSEVPAVHPTVWITTAELSRTGVPVVLDRFLRFLPTAARRNVHVIARRGGPLQERIAREVGSLTVLEPGEGRTLAGAAVAGLRSVGAAAGARTLESVAWRARLRRLPRPDVVLAHGAGGWPIAELVAAEVPVVLHLHELDAALDRSIDPSVRRQVLARCTRVMAVSAAVAELARRSGAPEGRVEVVPGVADAAPPHDAAAARRRLAALPAVVASGEVTERTRWVLGAGRPSWRKGTDRLAPLAHELARRGCDARVGWVGGRPGGADAEWVGAADPVVWLPEVDDPWSLLAGASVFVVPSREDPLPLVALEAGRHALPVVSTPSGGITDLLADGRGAVAGAHDLRELCDLVEQVLGAPDRASVMGAALAAEVEAAHRIEVVGPRWWWTVLDAAADPSRR